MIETGLPYNMDLMDQISQEGALVDMSSVSFPGITEENKIRTCFIYLRNTGFKGIKLDFSKCSYEEKAKFLKEYLTTDIIYSIPELNTSWLKICTNAIEQIEYPCILDAKERIKFFKENEEFLQNLMLFFFSLPVYLFSRFKIEGNRIFNLNKVQHSEIIPCNANGYNLIDAEFIDLINYFSPEVTPIFFDKIFTEENNDLFERLKDLSCYNFIQTMATWTPEDFLELVEEMKKFNIPEEDDDDTF